MTTPSDDHGDDRRKAERRNRNLAFEGQDRRAVQRRAASDRRASRR
jgi:hypothetical protein